MRGLKFLVIFLGVVLLAGFVVLGVTIAKRASSKLTGDPNAAAPAAFDASPIALPKGSRIEETQVEGDRLFLRLTLENGAAQILILSVKDGSRLGTIALEPSP